MARTTSDVSGYRSNTAIRHLRHAQKHNANRKRDFHEVDVGFSQSHPNSSAPWPSTGITTATDQSRVNDVQVYDPGDYCSKLANEAGALQFAAKKQRVDGFDESQPFARSATSAPNMCVPLAPDVATNMSTSMSNHLSPCSLTSSEAMSRQSSVSSASVTDAFDMMRVESSFSNASDLFPLDLDGSFVSCVTEKPASRQSTSGLYDGSASQLLSSVDCVSMDAFSFYGHNFSAAAGGQQNIQQTDYTHSTSEDSILDTASIERKASERRRKHMENSRQSIAPKGSTEVRASCFVEGRVYWTDNLTYRRARLQLQDQDRAPSVASTTKLQILLPQPRKRPSLRLLTSDRSIQSSTAICVRILAVRSWSCLSVNRLHREESR